MGDDYEKGKEKGAELREKILSKENVDNTGKILICTGVGAILAGPIGIPIGFVAGVMWTLIGKEQEESGENEPPEQTGNKGDAGTTGDEGGDDPSGE